MGTKEPFSRFALIRGLPRPGKFIAGVSSLNTFLVLLTTPIGACLREGVKISRIQGKKMNFFTVILLAVIACASGEAPPIPYAAATTGPQPGSYAAEAADDRIHHFAEPDHFGSDGFNVQSGYEGYLIPASEHGVLPLVDGLDLKTHHGLLGKVVRVLVSLGSKVVPKVVLGAVVLFALFLVGGCVNALVCSFTPFCSISFAGFGVNKDMMRSYLTPDRISSTTTFVLDAINKYKDMFESMSNDVDPVKKAKK